jgi:hypothetical protein
MESGQLHLAGLHVLDEGNWECEPLIVIDGKAVQRIEMREGQLHQEYWSEDR